MLLEDYIRQSIYTYPSLYKDKTYELSRLKVLDHIFLCIGTGLEWSKNGELCELTGSSVKKGRKTLPKDFFEKRLWELEVYNDKLDKVKKYLKSRNIKFYVSARLRNKIVRVYFFEDRENVAHKVILRFHIMDDLRNDSPEFRKDMVGVYEMKSYYQFNPYPLCGYSPIVEMLNGRTNSLHIDNFDLTMVKQDWIDGAIDVAKASLEYYMDDEKSKNHIYHPDRSTYLMEDNLQRAIKEKREDKFRKEHNWPKTQTALERTTIFWNGYVDEQIRYLEDFLGKFNKS